MRPIRNTLQPSTSWTIRGLTLNPAQYVVSTGGLKEAELELGELSSSQVLAGTIFRSATGHTVKFLYYVFFSSVGALISARSLFSNHSTCLAPLGHQKELKG
jgi:hypothetical protein